MSEAFTAVPLTPIRKVIAARMTEAQQTIPHFRVTADIELDALLRLRAQLRERNPQLELSINDLLIKGCADALMDVPAVNIQWAHTQVHQFHSADVSVVTALEGGGLSTPILRNADTKSVGELAQELRELTRRAAQNALRMDEVFGGSFSISNLGMYGVDQFDAIVNPPQCAILAVGAAKPRAIASTERNLRVATVMRATLSVDHRAIDGATAATFLAALRRRLEQPHGLYTAA
jgi:pyruvate dehydrogenase E2 component (dihydrolipoamide acetyltransferase)